MKIILGVLTIVSVLLAIISILVSKKLRKFIRLSFLYVLFLTSFISVIYLLIIYPSIAREAYFSMSVIICCLLGLLMILWDSRKYRGRLTALILFIGLWWLATFVLFLIFG